MAADPGERPVPPLPSHADQPAALTRNHWPDGALDLAERLQVSLAISDRDWHALKHQRPRRAAEQIAAALVQLLAADDPCRPKPTEARERAISLLDHGLSWLRAEISDPGCASHSPGHSP
jgi:hypothetical protein